MGKHKKKSDKHKHRKEKKHKRRRSSDSSSSEGEWVEKKVEKSTNKTSNDKDYSSSSENEWIEKPLDDKSTRDEWMNMDQSFHTISRKEEKANRKEMERNKKLEDQYNPSTSSRELNPYWKNGGTGIPTLKKPSDTLDYYATDNRTKSDRSFNWKKKSSTNIEQKIESKPVDTTSENLNAIAAKLVKAEIMGNQKLIDELKLKLEEARRNQDESKEVILTETDSKGFSRPYVSNQENPYNKRKTHDTHENNKRTKYFPDDDKYSLQQMFQQEKYNDSDSLNKEFANIASKVRKNDSLSDLFVDTIRKDKKDSRDKVVSKNEEIMKALDGCIKCINNSSGIRNLIIETSELIYLSLPKHEPLTVGHCYLTPIRHVTCSTQLDENEWEAFANLRRRLIDRFAPNNLIFFETAVNFHKHPHMHIECVPVPEKMGPLAAIYFKKAIEESEYEWSHNKKLISLKEKDVRRAVPKGLPYFFVSFGTDGGFAHVIEDQRSFPRNFAQEIIGGMLDLSHRKWKRPEIESFDKQSKRVTEFNKLWLV